MYIKKPNYDKMESLVTGGIHSPKEKRHVLLTQEEK